MLTGMRWYFKHAVQNHSLCVYFDNKLECKNQISFKSQCLVEDFKDFYDNLRLESQMLLVDLWKVRYMCVGSSYSNISVLCVYKVLPFLNKKIDMAFFK